jgi:hypothetical protein
LIPDSAGCDPTIDFGSAAFENQRGRANRIVVQIVYTVGEKTSISRRRWKNEPSGQLRLRKNEEKRAAQKTLSAV